MAQMNVSVPEALKAWAESRVAQGRHSSTSDYIRDLIRRDQDAEKFRALKSAIDEGLASPETETSVRDIVAEYHAQR